DGGRIINISSATTRIASPFTHYAMGKGAIDVLSHTLAQALGPRGITVNTVNPGVIDTDTGAWMHTSAQVEAAIVAATALGRGRPRRGEGSGRPPTSRAWSRPSPPTTPAGSPASRPKPAAATGSDRR